MSPLALKPVETEPPEPYEGMEVTEEQYWQHYYEGTEGSWEYNDGRLEEKGVSDWIRFRCYDWFIRLLMAYLDTNPVADRVGLDMGFRLSLAGKVKIRKPDHGIVLHANPVQLADKDRSYHSIFDICSEGLSDSDKTQKGRDTLVKYAEYAQGGVREYYILHSDDGERAFYRLGPRGSYQPMPVTADGVVRSGVLAGFGWRLNHLDEQPALEDLIDDPIYSDYVLPTVRRLRTEKALAEKRAREAEQRAGTAEKRADDAEARAERYARMLRTLGIDPNGD